jgi:hypothetical protein
LPDLAGVHGGEDIAEGAVELLGEGHKNNSKKLVDITERWVISYLYEYTKPNQQCSRDTRQHHHRKQNSCRP